MAQKRHILALVAEAQRAGARLKKACETIGICMRTLQRWQRGQELGDKRQQAASSPANKLSSQERQQVLDTLNSPEYRDLPPHQVVAALADKGQYVASEATMHRILKDNGHNAHRQAARPRRHSKPEEVTATAANQVWSWDITLLPGPVKGTFFYLYLIMDVYSRKIVAWQVHDRENPSLAAELIREGCYVENIQRDQLVLHSDNGSPMKGATMLATLQQLGVMPSFSRPSVSNDNAFSEALFRTLKYRPWYPQQPFASLEQARIWVAGFIHWYNHEHKHSKIAYVTPHERHNGEDIAILEKRKAVYEKAKSAHPNRWSGKTRQWQRPMEVSLNKKRTSKFDKQLA